MTNTNSQIQNPIETKEVDFNQIVLKETIQQREDLNESCVKDYVEELENGTVFPPLVVYDDGESLLLTDGFHRYAAFKEKGIERVMATIHKGNERDAILHAVGANSDHGLRRTNADKKKAVETLLKDEIWGAWSDTSIAKRCRVSQPFVGKIRAELTQNGFEFSTKRIGADGREIETSNIGSTSKERPPEETPIEQENGSQQSDTEPSDGSDEGQSEPSMESTGSSVAEDENQTEEDNGASAAESANDSEGDADNEPDESTSDMTEDERLAPNGDPAEQDNHEE